MSDSERSSSPFRNSNYSLYFIGQVISATGIWFQNLTLQLVILQATGSAQALSGVTIAQFLPLIVFGVIAGRLLDRVSARTVLLVTSLMSAGVTACMAFALVDEPHIWVIYALVGVIGTIQAFERIAAQTVIFELVGQAGLSRGASTSTIALSAARSVGPSLAGLAFQAWGPVVCILINALSYGLVFVSRLLIRPADLHPRITARSGQGASDRPALSASGRRDVRTLLTVNILIALLATNFGLILTSTVGLTFSGDASAVGAVHALNAVGAVVGGLLASRTRRISMRSLVWATLIFGLTLAVNAAVPTLWLFLAVAPLLGLGIGFYQATLQAVAQESVPPSLIGRMMSWVTMTGYGMMPFGALLLGWVIDASSGRTALAIGAVAAFSCAAFVLFRTTRSRD